MDCSYGTVIWKEGAYLLVRQDAAHGFILLPARIGSPVDSSRVTAELGAHSDVWMPGNTVLFRTLGEPDGSGVQAITLLRPDAKRPSHGVDFFAEPVPSTSFWWGLILAFAILGLLGHRQAQAQSRMQYRSTAGRLLDVRTPSLLGLFASFLRQSVGYRPGDWRGVEPIAPASPNPPAPAPVVSHATPEGGTHATPPAP